MAEEDADEVKKLLANVANLTFEMGERQRQGVGFNIFRLCSVDHFENAHSRIIAEFLNPQGSHGLGDELLRQFLALPSVAEHLKKNGFPFQDEMRGFDSAIVLTEEAFPGGRCDITIHWGGWCIVIENKIYAADQAKQLKRYEQAIWQTGEKPMLLYLTLDGHAAREDGDTKVDYCRLSYRDDIAKWLEECATVTKAISGVHEALIQYRILTKELSGTSEEQKMDAEIVNEMVATPESFKAACKVSAAVQAARAQIACKIMEALREEVKSRPVFDGWILQDQLASLLMENGRYTGFWLEREAADKPYDIYCEFQARSALRDMFFGLTRREEKRNEAIVAFLRAAERSEKLKTKYTFYAEAQPGWIYGRYPLHSEQRTWSDDLLARLIDPEKRHQFVVVIANLLQTLLEEAEEVERSINVAGKSR